MTPSAPAPAAKSPDMPSGCGMNGLLETLTRPWTLHIMWLLSRNGPMRFGAMRRSIEGISARLLTLRLRTLEEKGFVRRTATNTNPPQVTYSPTPRLKEMDGVMHHLHTLSARWNEEDAPPLPQHEAPAATRPEAPAASASTIAA